MLISYPPHQFWPKEQYICKLRTPSPPFTKKRLIHAPGANNSKGTDSGTVIGLAQLTLADKSIDEKEWFIHMGMV
jgi:hypothetical protein